MNFDQIESEKLYNNRFFIKKKISAGSFGVVFLCEDLQTKEYVAMKVEKDDTNVIGLDREIQMLDELRKIPGIPKIIWAGNDHDRNCLVMQLLGRDLSYHMKELRTFSLKCVVNIILQVIQIIEGVHRRGIIHRDMKPENIMTGKDQELNQIFLADFGIAKFYREPDGTHTPFKESKPFVGTTRYASINAHKGYELSRRDDLESIGYMFIYMLKGKLPWQTFHNVNEKEKVKIVGQMKSQISIEELCKDCPQQFYQYFQYVKQLQYKSSPDYRYLYSLFEQIAIQNGFKHDKRFDWTEFSQGTTKVTVEQTQQETRQQVQRKSKVEDKSPKNSELNLNRTELNQQQKDTSKSRIRSRHQSEQRVNKSGNSANSYSSSCINSQQSSVLINYQNSQFTQSNVRIGSSKLLSRLQERGIIHKNSDSRSSIIQQQSSKSFRERNQSSQYIQQGLAQQQQQSQHNNSQMVQRFQEDFQDLEELEERLQKDKQSIQRNQQHKNNKPLKVKEIQHHFEQNDNFTEIGGMTQLEDDASLENKVKIYNFDAPKLKQRLAKY
ncbi:unnamed protein product [Paramecium octaurelia]|uniref:Casein kinase I n=1 Tax=Paramecium octaurelia TaxID=43137 RepID=A0A8S1T9L8_PAROT|nr:unnamed protein product [Paramecium octaurelia]